MNRKAGNATGPVAPGSTGDKRVSDDPSNDLWYENIPDPISFQPPDEAPVQHFNSGAPDPDAQTPPASR